MAWNAETKALLDKPGIRSDECVVCGNAATDQHHVVQKGIGGVPAEVESRIPTVSLCRRCHREVHAARLAFRYCDRTWMWSRGAGIWHNCRGQQEWTTFGGAR